MENQQRPSLCRADCGFFGSPSTDGFCSKCFKEISLKGKKDAMEKQKQCRGNCGFYGSLATDGFCSKCFKKTTAKGKKEMEKQTPNSRENGDSSESSPSTSPSTSSDSNKTNIPSSQIEGTASPVLTDAVGNSETDAKPKKNRCHICNKWVGLTGITCRCKGTFCGSHRYANKHECSFDYQTMEREALRKDNPVVKAEKIKKI